jgi:LPS-assembly lipoprotein
LLSPWRLLPLLLLLVGCGFHLRGAIEIPPGLEPVYLQSGGLVGQAVDQRLRASGVAVTADAKAAGLVLRILDQSRSSRVVAIDRDGKGLAYALEFRVRFDAIDRGGQTLMPAQQISLERTFDDNPDVAVLGKQLESDIIYQDMADDAADQLLLRLRAAVLGRAAPTGQPAVPATGAADRAPGAADQGLPLSAPASSATGDSDRRLPLSAPAAP